jgi:hypothetical protein
MAGSGVTCLLCGQSRYHLSIRVRADVQVEANMKKLVGILMALAVTPLLAAGSDVNGKWSTWKQKDFPVELQLTASGSTLAGTVRLGTGQAADIFEGKIVGALITFKATVPDGDGEYTMLFTGRRAGNRIDFKCDVDVNVPGDKLEFGPACVARLSVRRAAH